MSSSDSLPVFIIEDNVTTNNLLRDWLQEHFVITSFLSAEAAIQDLGGSEAPAVFVVDYNLPAKNGLELLAAVKPHYPKAKYILISGLFDEKLQKEAREAGYDELLPKPFAMPVILKKITGLFGLPSRKSKAKP